MPACRCTGACWTREIPPTAGDHRARRGAGGAFRVEELEDESEAVGGCCWPAGAAGARVFRRGHSSHRRVRALRALLGALELMEREICLSPDANAGAVGPVFPAVREPPPRRCLPAAAGRACQLGRAVSGRALAEALDVRSPWGWTARGSSPCWTAWARCWEATMERASWPLWLRPARRWSGRWRRPGRSANAWEGSIRPLAWRPGRSWRSYWCDTRRSRRKGKGNGIWMWI